MRVNYYWQMALAATMVILTACNNGGNLSLESGAVVTKKKGAPFVTINQGGKSLVVENGRTYENGVHGWISVQTVSSRGLADGAGSRMVVNKTSSLRQ